MADVSLVEQTGILSSASPSVADKFQELQAPTGPWSTYARVLVGKKRPSATMTNEPGQRTGPGPQPLRGIHGFPGQQQQLNRNALLGAGRLPNGKLGTPFWT